MDQVRTVVASPVRPAADPPVQGRGPGRPGRDARRELRRLRDRDRRSARLAELHGLRALVLLARDLIRAGWLQNAWAAYPAEDGGTRLVVSSRDLAPGLDEPVGLCLVGALVSAGGGPAAAREQPVQRALDLTWHALHGDPAAPVRWCPSPNERAAHVRDLTRWNDAAGRTAADVTALLDSAEQKATREICRYRATSEPV
jgi:hypothetical protein